MSSIARLRLCSALPTSPRFTSMRVCARSSISGLARAASFGALFLIPFATDRRPHRPRLVVTAWSQQERAELSDSLLEVLAGEASCRRSRSGPSSRPFSWLRPSSKSRQRAPRKIGLSPLDKSNSRYALSREHTAYRPCCETNRRRRREALARGAGHHLARTANGREVDAAS